MEETIKDSAHSPVFSPVLYKVSQFTVLQKSLLAAIVALAFSLNIWVGQTFEFRGHYTGDDESSISVWYGGLNFARHGFNRLHFVPIQKDIGAGPHDFADKELYYTHYPAATDFIQGLLFKAGLESRFSHQIFGMLISAIGVFLALQVLLTLFSVNAALMALAACLLSPYFVFWADSLHGYPWFFLFKWYLLGEILRVHSEVQSQSSLRYPAKFIRFFILGLVASWFSFDPIPSLLSLGVAFIFIVPREQRLKWGVLLMLAAPLGEVIGFALHVLKNSLVLGGPAAAADDMVRAFLFRTGSMTSGAANLNYDSKRHLVKYFLGMHWFFTLPVIGLALLGWKRLFRSKPNSLWKGLFLATLVAALAWQVLMRQHSMIHALDYRHAENFLILGFGLFCEFAFGVRFQGTSKKLNQYARSEPLVVYSVLALLLLHTGLGVLQWEGTPIKKYVISQLVSDTERQAWGCSQSNRLANSKELHGAKAIVIDLIKGPCANLKDDTGLRGRLAELALYWR